MRGRVGRLTAGAVLGLLLVVPAPAHAAVTAQVAETGWWSQRPGATEQPEGGVEVAAALGGPQSVAALRIAVTGGEVTTAKLTIEETGGVGQPTATLLVCPTSDQWKAANPGPWDDAPAPDCGNSVTLTRAEDGATWTADIGILLVGASTSLMIVPSPQGPSGLPVGFGYQVTFGKATIEAAGGGVGAGGLAPPVPESGGPPGDLGEIPGGGGTEPGSSPSFETPPPSSAGDPALDTSTPPPAPGDAGVAPAPDVGAVELDTSGGDAASSSPEGAVDAFAAGPTAAGGGERAKWGRLVFLLPFCAMVGAGIAYGRPWLRERGIDLPFLRT